MRKRSITSEEYRVRARFDEIAAHLRQQAEHPSLQKPLAYWALSSDRRLPYALLERSVEEVTATPFADILATSGVGLKKAAALLTLLSRVWTDVSSGDRPELPAVAEAVAEADAFQADMVSDAVWTCWRETVRRHQLEQEFLGRLAPSLQALPSVIWRKTLGDYLPVGLRQLRRMKTYGDKRVQAILEVFHGVHRALGSANPSTRLSIHLQAAFIPPIEQWAYAALEGEQIIQLQDLRQHLIFPLLNQIERDAGETVHQLVSGRLGIEAPPIRVQEQARELGLTRARVYQILETCSQIMDLRWPEGRWLFKLLGQKLNSHGYDYDAEAIRLLQGLEWLLYPQKGYRKVVEAVFV